MGDWAPPFTFDKFWCVTTRSSLIEGWPITGQPLNPKITLMINNFSFWYLNDIIYWARFNRAPRVNPWSHQITRLSILRSPARAGRRTGAFGFRRSILRIKATAEDGRRWLPSSPKLCRDEMAWQDAAVIRLSFGATSRRNSIIFSHSPRESLYRYPKADKKTPISNCETGFSFALLHGFPLCHGWKGKR